MREILIVILFFIVLDSLLTNEDKVVKEPTQTTITTPVQEEVVINYKIKYKQLNDKYKSLLIDRDLQVSLLAICVEEQNSGYTDPYSTNY